MTTEEKALHFLTAISDVYKDEENRELEAFSKLELTTDDMTDDITAMLVAFQFFVQQITGYDCDLIDFTHILNKLAVQSFLEKRDAK